ncbi:MAG: hypothetical protein EZS28_006324 [Streblomastix strix]|uniref:Uncharacterized protein n=1 Tax=Streblomastix strix TaxID=222440 RepID=A0A5J4WT83_9EUKA|nr:MAG: hypothetical protein EZS28_006324 [Streblomastix strix]
MKVHIDEALLDAAGLMDFPELYAYVREREPRPPVETAPPVPIEEQTLQEQVKINADIHENSKEAFISPEPNMPVKIDYGSQIINKLFVFNEISPSLAVYGDRVTLNCFVTIKYQFKGFVFNSYPQEAQPKNDAEIIALFKELKQINDDSNSDGKVDIMDVWKERGQIFPASAMVTVGDKYQTLTMVCYFITNGSTKQYSFSVEGAVVISPSSTDIQYYGVNGLYYFD